MNNVPSRAIRIASILFWVWGVIVLLSAVALGYPAFATRGDIAPLAIMLLIGAATCVAAYALRKRQWGVRWWAATLALLAVLLLMTMRSPMAWLGIALNATSLGLIAVSWNGFIPDEQSRGEA